MQMWLKQGGPHPADRAAWMSWAAHLPAEWPGFSPLGSCLLSISLVQISAEMVLAGSERTQLTACEVSYPGGEDGMPLSMGCHHVCPPAPVSHGGCSHQPHPPWCRLATLGSDLVLSSYHTEEAQWVGETHMFFLPFCVFKAVSSWEAGPLCCWAFR